MFSNQNAITVSVSQNDIDNATGVAGNTSLDRALKTKRNAHDLDGITTQSDVNACSVIETTIGAYLDSSSNPYAVRSLVCNYPYIVDTYGSLQVALEYLGFKPSAPYLTNLTKA